MENLINEDLNLSSSDKLKMNLTIDLINNQRMMNQMISLLNVKTVFQQKPNNVRSK